MVDQALYRDALGRFASGVTVVTAPVNGGGIAGLTASAFSSLSIDPPLILVCVGEKSASRAAFNATPYFAVHILAENQESAAMAFARSGDDKANGIPWTSSERGTPMLDDYLVALECERTEEFHGGDHAIIIGRIIDIRMSDCDRPPMTYYRGRLNPFSLKDGQGN